jgi:hypothetical protein
MNKTSLLKQIIYVVPIGLAVAFVVFPTFTDCGVVKPKTLCLSHLKSSSLALSMYSMDENDQMPDRRDLKAKNYRPWNNWPSTDPRIGWIESVIAPYSRDSSKLACPVMSKHQFVQVVQGKTAYWAWGFDKIDKKVSLDNFWGKTADRIIQDLNTQHHKTFTPATVEVLTDPKFPDNVKMDDPLINGKTPHFGGRNVSYLDAHVKFIKIL